MPERPQTELHLHPAKKDDEEAGSLVRESLPVFYVGHGGRA